MIFGNMLSKPQTIRSAGSRSAVRGKRFAAFLLTGLSALVPLTMGQTAEQLTAQKIARDPGVREGRLGAGSTIKGLTSAQQAFFSAGLMSFRQLASVTGSVPGTRKGLGPTFNALSCAQCHAQPAIGGSSAEINPQISAAIAQAATNKIPSFISARSPVRVARFPYAADMHQPDGSVHNLFTIAGRSDAPGCKIAQPDFKQAAESGNLIFRIPTPTFGGGLIEAIPDSALRDNMRADADKKHSLGIAGRPNLSPNDASITRFGWKEQNKSLEMAAAEADNLEIGVTNDLFPNELDGTTGCQFNGTPEDAISLSADGSVLPSDIIRFAGFMRLLDQPRPASPTPSTVHGERLFTQAGCALCHTPSFTTGQSSVAVLSNVQANLFSDLLLHHMGPKLADNIVQGVAQGDEFRTAPLWGLGQRIFFLHDGRTADLLQAIENHASAGDQRYADSEANAVIDNFNKLPEQDKQDLLNFLRSL
jgi:CxxC motif-containing protein (DUF1111 family)